MTLAVHVGIKMRNMYLSTNLQDVKSHKDVHGSWPAIFILVTVYFTYNSWLSFMVVFGVWEYQQNTRQIIHGIWITNHRLI
jgi:hypothetical protein